MKGPVASRAPVVVQIVPTAPGGVRDFADCLKAEWEQRQVASHVIALDRSDARAVALHERLAALQESDSAPVSILLHFSGYGYERRALCFWLLKELRAARRVLGPRLRVVTMIHELYASGSPWQSAFWIGGVQAHVTRSMARLSDALWTNTSYHGDWLGATVKRSTPVRVRPVFSTVGEPNVNRPLEDRGHGLVVFGSRTTRQRALARVEACTRQLLALGVDRLIEVGDGPASVAPPTGLPYEHVGRLDERAIGALLQQHRFALIDYPPLYIGKSTVFAAYASHGCLVLNTDSTSAAAEGLQPGRHYLVLGEGGPVVDPGDHEVVAWSATEWYQGHRMSLQASEFLEWLGVLPLHRSEVGRVGLETSEATT